MKARSNKAYSWDQSTKLQMKFDWEVHNPALIKVVGQSASGKSVKVEVSIERYDGGTYTYPVNTIRMDNLNAFIGAEVRFRDDVESKLEEFEIKQGLLL